jgi:hypothetical protein
LAAMCLSPGMPPCRTFLEQHWEESCDAHHVLSALPPKADTKAGLSESPLCATSGCEQSQQDGPFIRSPRRRMVTIAAA